MNDARETGNDTRNAINSLVPVGKTNRYQMSCHLVSAWQPLWYRFVFSTGTNGSLRHRLKNPVSKGEAIGLGLWEPVGKPVPKGVSNRFSRRVF